jgi:TRAP-type C4-dicarboxylate transport system permease small subunit
MPRNGSWYSRLVEHLGVGLVVALAVVVVLQVFNRYVLKAPLSWTEELAMLLFQWVAFLGAAVGVKRMSHFGIDLVVRGLAPARARLVRLLVMALMGVVAVTMLVEGARVLGLTHTEMYTTMPLSHAWAYAAIPVSGVLMLGYLLPHVRRVWKD